jgi:large subunit ribosomal protein MRP49
MTVNRTPVIGSPCTLSIHLASPNAPSSKPPVNSTIDAQTSSAQPTKTQPGPQTEKVAVIFMKNKTVSQILTELYNLTKGKQIKPTVDETRQLRELEEFKQRSAEVREKQQLVNEARKREEAILTQARGEVEAMKEV